MKDKTDAALFKEIQTRLEALSTDFDRLTFLQTMLEQIGYCTECGGKFYKVTPEFYGCNCWRNE